MSSTQEEVKGNSAIALIGWAYGHRYLIVITAVTTALLSVAITFALQPVYQSSVVLVSASNGAGSASQLSSTISQLGGLAGLGNIAGATRDADAEEALAVLRSRSFLERYITDENLLPQLHEKGLMDSFGGDSEDDSPSLARAGKRFRDQIMDVKQDRRTGLTTLQIAWSDRVAAAKWANGLVDRINAEMRTRAQAKAERSVKFLQQELTATTDIATREAINRLIEAQVKQRMIINVTPDYAFKIVDSARPAEKYERLFPKRRIFGVAGLFVGLVLGVLLAQVGDWMSANKSALRQAIRR